MELLYSKQTKLGNYIDLIGEPAEENILIVGVVHGDEPQGKYLIERYLEERGEGVVPIFCINLQKN